MMHMLVIDQTLHMLAISTIDFTSIYPIESRTAPPTFHFFSRRMKSAFLRHVGRHNIKRIKALQVLEAWAVDFIA